MPVKFNVFPLDSSPGYIIHRADMQMKAGLSRVFQANGFDITPEQWGVLSRLWQSEGIHQSELAARTAKDRHNITRILSLLEKNGYVHRVPDIEDKRRQRVYLTPDGHTLQNKLTPLVIGFLQTCFEGLSQKDVHAFRRILNRIANNLKNPKEK